MNSLKKLGLKNIKFIFIFSLFYILNIFNIYSNELNEKNNSNLVYNWCTVKIEVMYKNKSLSKGTGIVYKYQNNFVLLTAYHTFYYKFLDIKKDDLKDVFINIYYRDKKLSLFKISDFSLFDSIIGIDARKDFIILQFLPIDDLINKVNAHYNFNNFSKEVIMDINKLDFVFENTIQNNEYSNFEANLFDLGKSIEVYHIPMILSENIPSYSTGNIDAVLPKNEDKDAVPYVARIGLTPAVSPGSSGGSAFINGKFLGLLNWEFFSKHSQYKKEYAKTSTIGYITILSKSDIITCINSNKNKIEEIVMNNPPGEVQKIIMLGKDPEKRLILRPPNVAGIIVVSTGALFTITGSAIFIYDNAVYYPSIKDISPDNTPYDEYVKSKQTDIALFSSGLTVLSIGVCMISASIPLMLYKKKKTDVTFNIESGKEITLSLKVKL